MDSNERNERAADPPEAQLDPRRSFVSQLLEGAAARSSSLGQQLLEGGDTVRVSLLSSKPKALLTVTCHVCGEELEVVEVWASLAEDVAEFASTHARCYATWNPGDVPVLEEIPPDAAGLTP